MIKFTGTIVGSNGVATYTNGLINLNISMPNKWAGTLVRAEIGEKTETVQTYEVQEPNPEPEGEPIIASKTTTIEGWNVFNIADSFTTKEVINPSFEDMQEIMLASLKTKYPSVEFEIL